MIGDTIGRLDVVLRVFSSLTGLAQIATRHEKVRYHVNLADSLARFGGAVTTAAVKRWEQPASPSSAIAKGARDHGDSRPDFPRVP